MGITQPLVSIAGVSVMRNGTAVLDNISLDILPGECWAIVGASGSGKTTLAEVLSGRILHNETLEFHSLDNHQDPRILFIEQQHRFKNRSNTNDFYYQQRYNSMDAEDSITVAEALDEVSYLTDGAKSLSWIRLLHMDELMRKPLIQLSNGENKRLQLAKALLQNPRVLVMDSPFTGLDVEGRQTLGSILGTIVAEGICVILVTAPQELPACVTHVALLENGRLVQAGEKDRWHPNQPDLEQRVLIHDLHKSRPQNQDDQFSVAVNMVDVTILYGERTILDQINWRIEKGERWSLTGPNGAGKSTLLSLITADNPQAYANELYLFDKRRGRGESIWEIKRRIGFVSPELHVYFDRGSRVFDVIASGLFDTMGLFRRLNAEQREQVLEWMDVLQLLSFMDKALFQLSLGEQRMVLLARALVKDPPLLILDEPTQGLDENQIAYFKQLINELCTNADTTLLYVSHYAKDIPECVTRAARLENGRLFITTHSGS